MPSHLTPTARKRLAQALRGTLRTARQSAALTQEQMAQRVGVGTSTYRRLERGLMAPGPGTLRRLCQVLCLSLEELVGSACAATVRRAPRRPARPRTTPRRRSGPPPLVPPLPVPPGTWGGWPLTLLLVRRGTPLAVVVDVG
jgi:DNA-binding XRE family transcriptional regulator